MIKNLEEDFGFMLVIIVQDIIKLFQKLLTAWKNGPNLTKGNINWSKKNYTLKFKKKHLPLRGIGNELSSSSCGGWQEAERDSAMRYVCLGTSSEAPVQIKDGAGNHAWNSLFCLGNTFQLKIHKLECVQPEEWDDNEEVVKTILTGKHMKRAFIPEKRRHHRNGLEVLEGLICGKVIILDLCI